MSYETRLSDAIEKAETASGIMRDFTALAADVPDISTEGGPLPPLRKWLRALQLQVLSEVAVLLPSSITGADHTIDADDAGRVVEFNNAAPTLTLSNGTFPIRAHCALLNLNGANITVAAGTGIILRGPTSLDGQAMHSIYRASANIYYVIGKEASA